MLRRHRKTVLIATLALIGFLNTGGGSSEAHSFSSTQPLADLAEDWRKIVSSKDSPDSPRTKNQAAQLEGQAGASCPSCAQLPGLRNERVYLYSNWSGGNQSTKHGGRSEFARTGSVSAYSGGRIATQDAPQAGQGIDFSQATVNGTGDTDQVSCEQRLPKDRLECERNVMEQTFEVCVEEQANASVNTSTSTQTKCTDVLVAHYQSQLKDLIKNGLSDSAMDIRAAAQNLRDSLIARLATNPTTNGSTTQRELVLATRSALLSLARTKFDEGRTTLTTQAAWSEARNFLINEMRGPNGTNLCFAMSGQSCGTIFNPGPLNQETQKAEQQRRSQMTNNPGLKMFIQDLEDPLKFMLNAQGNPSHPSWQPNWALGETTLRHQPGGGLPANQSKPGSPLPTQGVPPPQKIQPRTGAPRGQTGGIIPCSGANCPQSKPGTAFPTGR